LEFFAGHCSDDEFDLLLSKVDTIPDIVIGVGGGQCLDTAKFVANRLNVPIVTVSTLACQFQLEGKQMQEILEMIHFYRKIGLPISLFDLGMMEIREEELRIAAKKACAPEEMIHMLPFPILEEKVYEAIHEAHRLGENVKNNSAFV
jgi:glycerol dehydrogenase-like iron-containing ADH family enzyme